MTELETEHGNPPKHLFFISVYPLPSGDISDTTTSSSRLGLEKVITTDASVIATPELCCSVPAKVQTLALVLDIRVAATLLLADSGTMAIKGPKLDPVTLMLLMLCEVEVDVEGALYENTSSFALN